ncbi:MAG TPA: HEAT repeat domain-containing protein [Pirellulales bacterium]|jgi:hypothetical protein|nr:HEAT repeat domain-containing protein [Pirellulales bacterium]
MRRRLQFSIRSLFVLILIAALSLFAKREYDAYRRLALVRGWIATCIAKDEAGTYFAELIQLPTGMTEADEMSLLDTGLNRYKSPEEQAAFFKMLVERHPSEAKNRLLGRLKYPAEPEVRALQLHLLGLYRDKTIVDRLVPFLDDSKATVRAAAVESIGFIRCPSFRVPLAHGNFGLEGPATESMPAINVDDIVFSTYLDGGLSQINSLPDDREPVVIEVPQDLRARFETMMLSGASAQERAAAARALLTWPPADYRLRVAEWGVWLNDEGDLKLMQAVLDEIPGFVHRTGNRLASLQHRVNRIMFVTKPIVHITVDRPLAVDFDVLISHGRPWFAYPRPDDFTLTAGVAIRWNEDQTPEPRPLERYDRVDQGELVSLSEGYPWLRPHHRMSGPTVAGGPGGHLATNVVTSVGLHWQSLIVSPQLQKWMHLPDVTEPNHDWWKRLREVPSAYVNSQGETERFLYYDGPTLLNSPVGAVLSDDELSLTDRGAVPDDDLRDFALRPGDGRVVSDASQARRGMFVEVRDGRPQGRRLGLLRSFQRFLLSSLPPLEGDEALDAFRSMLAETGLTDDEIAGLLASWQQHFFKTEGRRLLLVMSKDDYGAMCPLVVRPTPTELVRVGIVLMEF